MYLCCGVSIALLQYFGILVFLSAGALTNRVTAEENTNYWNFSRWVVWSLGLQ